MKNTIIKEVQSDKQNERINWYINHAQNIEAKNTLEVKIEIALLTLACLLLLINLFIK